jgi:hypothetical protein
MVDELSEDEPLQSLLQKEKPRTAGPFSSGRRDLNSGPLVPQTKQGLTFQAVVMGLAGKACRWKPLGDA